MVMDTANISDADALLMASASPSSNSGPIMATTLAETTPVSPVPGGAIVTLNTEPPQVNMATVDTAPPANDFDPKVLLWVGAGIGTAWLLSRSDRSVSGPKKQNWLVPALILGAGAAWYFFGDKITAATSSTTTTPAGGGGTTLSATDQQRQALQQRYNGQPTQLAVINSADAATLQKWTLLMSMWDNGWTSQRIYSVGLDGTTPASWDNSIGKWWENFSAANHF